jgi:hypothetical protein
MNRVMLTGDESTTPNLEKTKKNTLPYLYFYSRNVIYVYSDAFNAVNKRLTSLLLA